MTEKFKNKLFSKGTLYWLGLLAFLLIFHANHPLDSDEGLLLNGAWNLINGRNLYIDFFEFHPPGCFYLVFWIWKIFGVGYWTAKITAIFILLLGCFGIYKISKEINGESKYNYLGPSAFAISSLAWPIINHNVFNITLVIWAVYSVLKGLSTAAKVSSAKGQIIRKKIALSIGGLLTGVSLLFLQQKGLATLMAISCFLFISSIFQIAGKRPSSEAEPSKSAELPRPNDSASKWQQLKISAYYLLFSLLPLSLLFLQWPAKMLYENLIIFPVVNYCKVSLVPYNLLLSFATASILAGFLLREEIHRSNQLQMLFFIQFVLLLTTLPMADFFHVGLVLFPLYSLLPLIIEKTNKFTFRIAIICHLCIWALVIKMTLPPILAAAPFSTVTTDSYVPIAYVRKHCPQPDDLYAGPFLPGIYFETKKLNPTPYSVLLTRLFTAEQFADARKYLENTRPACAIINYAMVEKYKYDKNNPVDAFITENYERVLKEGDTEVYIIKEKHSVGPFP